MKKFLMLAPILLIGWSSCRKDRSCTCSDNNGELGTALYTNATRNEAKKACQALEAQYKISNPSSTCTLR